MTQFVEDLKSTCTKVLIRS